MKKSLLAVLLALLVCLTFALVSCGGDDGNGGNNTDAPGNNGESTSNVGGGESSGVTTGTSADSSVDTSKPNDTERHTVSFITNCEGEIEPIAVEHGAKIPTPSSSLAKQGYTFGGWYYGDVEWVFVGYVITEDMVLEAKWIPNENILMFDANGGRGTMANMTIATDSSTSLTTNGFVNEGYAFIGWANTPNGEVVYADGGEYAMGTEPSYTLYAQWQANNNSIVFDANGGEGTMENMVFETDSIVSLTANKFTKDGYIFIGWAMTPNGNVEYVDGANYKMGTESTYTLYAVWGIVAYTVKFEGNGGAVAVDSMTFTAEQLPIVLDNSAYKKDYTFIGWCEREDLSDTPFTEITSSGYKTLYAKYEYGTQGITYEETEDGYEVTGYTGSEKDIKIPSVHNGKAVTSIGSLAFAYHVSITSVEIPNSVTIIDSSAFAYCDALSSVVIGENVTAIERNAFYDCYSIESVNYLGTIAQWCNISFNVNSSNPLYKGADFYVKGERITELVVPSGVTKIGDYAFYYCGQLTSVEMPGSVATVGEMAFQGCASLESVNYLGTIAQWCNISFDSEYSNPLQNGAELCLNGEPILDELIIPEGVTTISNYAFYKYTSINSIVLPNSITDIGSYTFSKCKIEKAILPVTAINSIPKDDLKAIVISGGESIDANAFKYFTNLASIEFANSITEIGESAFEKCTGLKSVNYLGTIVEWCNVSFANPSSNPLYHGASLYVNGELVTELVFQDNVSSVGNYAFYGCKSITSIEILSSITEIGKGAFLGCPIQSAIIPTAAISSIQKDKLKTVVINGGTSIDISAFSGCTSLKSVEITSSVTTIGISAFSDCTSLKSVEIPSSVTTIGYRAFSGCTSLKSVEIPNSVTSIGNYAFYGCSIESATMPMLAVSSISQDRLRYVVINGGTTIVKSDFENCRYLASLVIGDSVTTIAPYAFENHSLLIDVTLGKGVTTIGENAFLGCYRLVEICNLSNLEISSYSSDHGNIGYYALNIYTASSGEKKTFINNNLFAFYVDGETRYLLGDLYGDGDFDVILPTSCNGQSYMIYWSAFYDCDYLMSIRICDGVTSIDEYAFYGCEALFSIEIGSCVKSIGRNAFDGTTSLRSVNYTGTIGEWCNISFEDYTANPLGTWCDFYINYDRVDNIVIPEGVTKINDYAFYCCNYLKSVVIPDSVTSIGDWAFYYCTSLTSVVIGNSVTSIGNEAFAYCYSLTSVTFKNPNGWYYSRSLDETAISSEDLLNESTAVEYLKNTYCNYYWYRK